MGDIIETGVQGTSAAHLVKHSEALRSHDKMTVVWSTRTVDCEPGDASHLQLQFGADSIPTVWDPADSGEWQVNAEQQCGCGSRVSVPAALASGHLGGADLARIAGEVAAQADDGFAAQAGVVAKDLAEQLRFAAANDDRDGLPSLAGMVEPGVGVDGGELVAWAYRPGGAGPDDFIEVRESDLARGPDAGPASHAV